MRLIACLVVGALLLIGCGSAGETPSGQGSNPPKEMPGGVGVTAGRSGTGATSGGSTGY